MTQDARASVYTRLMEGQERIARELYNRGVDDAAVQAALDQVDERLTEDERREDLYFSALALFVEALGGHLEVRAIFGEDTVVVRTSAKR